MNTAPLRFKEPAEPGPWAVAWGGPRGLWYRPGEEIPPFEIAEIVGAYPNHIELRYRLTKFYEPYVGYRYEQVGR